MVMIVAHPILVTRQRPGRLNAPNEALFYKQSERIVNCLTRNDANVGASFLRDHIGSPMRPNRDCPQNRQALGGYGKATFSQKFGGITQALDPFHVLDSVKN